jgi:hypothetical protein
VKSSSGHGFTFLRANSLKPLISAIAASLLYIINLFCVGKFHGGDMNILGIAVSFLFGILATIFTARIGQAIEKRNELLVGLADWIDQINEVSQSIIMDTTEIQEGFLIIGTRITLVKSSRWDGIVYSFRNRKLTSVYEEFVDECAKVPTHITNNKIDRDQELLNVLSTSINKKAINLHCQIGSMMISVF